MHHEEPYDIVTQAAATLDTFTPDKLAKVQAINQARSQTVHDLHKSRLACHRPTLSTRRIWAQSSSVAESWRTGFPQDFYPRSFLDDVTTSASSHQMNVGTKIAKHLNLVLQSKLYMDIMFKAMRTFPHVSAIGMPEQKVCSDP